MLAVESVPPDRGGYFTMLNNGCWAWASGETGTLCYWNFCGKNEKYLDENYLCQLEQQRERKEFMDDWLEYVGEFDG